MTNQKLNIPKTIHVGYQDRQGTYTGKLAYVIYTDQKGKKRKETSWNSWRSNDIEPNDFDNEPTSGFVLNKGVGGARGSWSSRNVRNEYIRVYDPRGFEFEISVANLLFILTECSAIKGKGIEGEFVYSWDGTELVLLPVDSLDYKASSEFTKLQTKKVTKKDMKEGRTYQHKDMRTLMYLGRHKTRKLDRYWYYSDGPNPLLSDPTHPVHVFYDLEDKKWHFERGFTKLAQIISEDSHPDFADRYTEFVGSRYVSPVDKIVMSPITIDEAAKYGGYHSNLFFIKVEDGYQLVRHSSHIPHQYYGNGNYYQRKEDPQFPEGMTAELFWPLHPVVVKEVTMDTVKDKRRYGHYHDRGDEKLYAVSRSYLEGKELFTPEIQLESNQTVEVSSYVERREDQRVPC